MPISPKPSGRRTALQRLRRSGVAVLGAAAVLLGTAFTSAAQADEIPGVDEVVTSDNITHVANLPKPAGFDTNSDLAFTGDYAIGGNYNGFVIYDISDPTEPEIVSQVLCQGGQGDVSVSGDLLYFSVDYPRANSDCGSPASTPADANAFEGIRIFDISDKANPQYVSAVDTDCGSHTNTLVPSKDGESDYIYVSSYAPSANFPNCQPPHDKISIIEVPLDDPASAAIVNEPVLFPDGGNEGQDGLLRPTEGCHDITAYPERDIAAGACMGDGVLMDISDRENPVVVEQVQDENFAFWHSATFTDNGRTVLFTDELGGGGAATCNDEIGPHRGADAIYTISGKLGKGDGPELNFASYYKIPRDQADTENCVAHNGSLIPVQGGNFFVQSWYQGGVSIIDFRNPRKPQEIGYFERGPLSDTNLVTGGSWSAYYYNGYIYSSDIAKGFDVLKVDDPRLNRAENVRYDEFNPQSQPRYGR
ncbi:LVIVD repeat-containing protein [Marinactinospora rubrisoli]|uniref:LVIVD repeat-containing protein n=1 Tax=Marinactinospora rubrisoli TaxID=2715399 RepID=A0ABW2KJ94_9ACTN